MLASVPGLCILSTFDDLLYSAARPQSNFIRQSIVLGRRA